MNDLKCEIENALLAIGENSREILNKSSICNEVVRVYVDGIPRVWWLSLKHIIHRVSFEDNSGYKKIPHYIGQIDKGKPNTDFVYFIADDDGISVYKIRIKHIQTIIEACRFFEYYITPSDFSWLICETDHDEIIICQEKRAVL